MWEEKKTVIGSVWLEGWKSGRIENILISLIFVWLGVKSGGMEKVSLYKFTYTLLLKIDGQLIQKSDKQPEKKKKKSNHPIY